MYSMLGEIEIAPRRCAPGPGHALEVRQPIQRHVNLARRAAELVAINLFQKVAGQMLRLDELR